MKLTTEKIIVILGAAVLLLSCVFIWKGCNPARPEKVTVITIDTQWLPSPPDTLWLQAPAVVSEKRQAIPDQYRPSDSCDVLKEQYNYLAQNYFTQRVYSDTITKDSTSLILSDTVENNRITGRMAIWNIKTPVITIKETTTITNPKRGQLYVGLGAGVVLPIDSIAFKGNVSLLFKSKKDRITTVAYGMDTRRYKYIELSRYVKIGR